MKTAFSLLIFLSIFINCTKPTEFNDPIPKHETLTIDSKILGEKRIINIWTPPQYAKNSEKFPVLYMPDGGVKEDFSHIANTLSKLIDSKKIPPFILVGIENTQRRRDLTGPTEVAKDKEIAPIVGGSENFRNFIKTELIPEINSIYRTSSEKGILGESLAGLFVTQTLLLTPDLFDYYIAFDPSIWWNNKEIPRTAKNHLTNFSTTEKRFWFAGSNAEDISVNTNELAKILEKEKIPNLKFNYSPEPKEKHNTIFRATKEKAFVWTLNK